MVNCVLVGVGGQGVLFAAKVLAQSLLLSGYDVKQSEVHGMAQRGGSVMCCVRAGQRVFAPVLAPGEADLLIGFESLEALRYVHYVKPGGSAIVNMRRIPPAPVSLGEFAYPDDVLERIRDRATTYVIDAARIARDLGEPRVANTVVLGAAAAFCAVSAQACADALRAVAKRNLEPNLKALAAGYEIGHQWMIRNQRRHPG